VIEEADHLPGAAHGQDQDLGQGHLAGVLGDQEPGLPCHQECDQGQDQGHGHLLQGRDPGQGHMTEAGGAVQTAGVLLHYLITVTGM
jgi:hypothetical protein